jgi:hypothetical protein
MWAINGRSKIWIVEKEYDWALHHRASTRPAQQLSCDIPVGQELQVSMHATVNTLKPRMDGWPTYIMRYALR